jgi:accessory gene regulator B
MIEKIAIDLVDQMTETKLIHKDMAERYIYVAICWMEKFITIGTIILISIAVEKFLPTLFFLLFFLGLRKRTGGYHLDKFYQCYLASVLSYLVILGISTSLVGYPQLILGMLLFAMSVIGIIGTVNHPNMHMDSAQLAESKKEARIILLLEGSIIYCCVLLGADLIFISYMAIAVILCAALLCIAKILKQEVKENEEG